MNNRIFEIYEYAMEGWPLAARKIYRDPERDIVYLPRHCVPASALIAYRATHEGGMLTSREAISDEAGQLFLSVGFASTLSTAPEVLAQLELQLRQQLLGANVQ